MNYLFFTLIYSTFYLIKGDLFIGGIFDDDEIGKQRIAAFEAAIEIANRQRFEETHKLLPLFKTVSSSNPFDAEIKTCSLLEQGSVAIFGPDDPENFEAVQSVCDQKEIPVIQTRWNFRPQRFTTIANLFPHPTELSKMYAEIVKQLNWNSFVVIYDDDESFQRLIDIFKLTQDPNYFIITRHLDPYGTGIYRRIMKDIAESGVNNILIDCSFDSLSEVLKQAQQVGIINRNYNFFITNLDFQTLDLLAYQYSSSNMTGISLIKKDAEVTKQLKKLMFSHEDESEGIISTSSALIADAMAILSGLLSDLEKGSPSFQARQVPCNSSNNWEFGSTLINSLKMQKYDGITGLVQFDNEGFRSNFGLNLIELQENGINDVGHWNVSFGYVQYPRINLKNELGEDDEDSDSLVNKTLKIITALTAPYTFLKNSADILEGNDRYEGFAIDLIDEMAKIDKFNYIFMIREDKSNGNRNPKTNTWSGMIGDIINGTADLAIADLTINSERAEAVDFTAPFMNLGIRILFKKPEQASPSFFSFADPFAIDTWISFGVAYVVVSLSLFIMGRISAAEWTNPFPCIEEPEYLINQFSLSNSFWFSTGTGLQQGTEIAPIAVSTRMVAGMWWFFILLMVASYTANLAAFLSTANTIKLFEDVNDLVEKADALEIRYGAKDKGATEKFFIDSRNHSVYGKIYSHMLEHREDMVKENDIGVKMASEIKYALFMESTSIEYETQRHCDLEMYGDSLDHKGYGIAMRKNSTYRSRLTTTILKLQSSGVIDDLKRKWWEERRGGGQCANTEASGDAEALDITSLEGVFYVTIMGLCAGTVFAVIENFLNVRNVSKSAKMPFKKALRCEMKYLLNFESDVKPVLGSTDNLAEGEEKGEEVPYGFIDLVKT